jgi:pyrimidine deaminase RibD-like protein
VNHTSTDRRVLSTGYSRELEGNTHAEANAIGKALGLVDSLSSSKAAIPQQPQPQPGGYGYAGGGYGYAGAGQKQDGSENTAADEPQVIDIDLYTTLEPCSTRASGLQSCTQTILDLNASTFYAATNNIRLRINRIFIGASEPPDFVMCEGAKLLSEHGIEVVWLGERKIRLSECDLVELVQPGCEPGEEVELASVCLRAARRGNE